jgi:hypothetical protein
LCSSGAHRKHLVAGHAEHVTKTKQHAESKEVDRRLRGGPKSRAGGKYECGAEPARLGIVAAVDPSADRQRGKSRDDRKPGGNDAEPDHGQAKLDCPIRGRDPDDQDQGLSKNDVREERGKQTKIDIFARGARTRRHGACLAASLIEAIANHE